MHITPLTAKPLPVGSIGDRLHIDLTLFLGIMQATTKVPDFHITLRETD